MSLFLDQADNLQAIANELRYSGLLYQKTISLPFVANNQTQHELEKLLVTDQRTLECLNFELRGPYELVI